MSVAATVVTATAAVVSRRDGQNGGLIAIVRTAASTGPRPEGGFRKPAEKKEGGAQ